MRTSARKVLADNLKVLMDSHIALSTQAKVAQKSGIAQRSVSNMLRVDSGSSPRLDQVERVAGAFGLATWQLLLDPQTLGNELAGALRRPAIQDDDKRLKKWDASKKHRIA